MNDQEIGLAVRQLRGGISQSRLAELMTARGFSWHQTTVAKTETGERPLRLTEALALADELGVDLTVFLPGSRPTEAGARVLELEHRLRRVRNILEED